MTPVTPPIDPQVRAACVAAVAKFKAALPPLIKQIADGKLNWATGLQFSMFLVAFAQEVSALIKENGAPGVLGAELVDAYSGSDPGALITLDFLASADQSEAIFDSLKPVIEQIINSRVQPVGGGQDLPPDR